MDRRDLKIEFCAHRVSMIHRLYYRVSPDQELTYKVTKRILGLFLVTKTKSISTEWKEARYFDGAKYREESSYLNWTVIGIENQDELNKYKCKYRTIGQFEDYLHKLTNDNYAKYKIEREKYLAETTMY